MAKNLSSEELQHLRHSLAHLLAAAVLELWPGTKRTIGPAIEDGFYYDFDFAEAISEEDLPKIEEKMREILKTWDAFERQEVSKEEALALFADNLYKTELINEFATEGQTLTLYKSGEYVDLCRGGHVEHAKEIDPRAFTLTKIAGAYWRGSEKNKQLTRIYGLAFASKEDLKAHIAMMEEAKKRDHRKLGKDLELFTIIDEIGPGLPLFYPKGALLRRTVEEYIAQLQESRGYTPIWIPHITKGRLYEISGHLAKYDAMYPPMQLTDEADYYLKPMNCPHFMMLYKSLPHSYRDLPVRYTSTTTNYRYEKSGELTGLTRVRSLTQDDCHVFARPDQIEQEITLMLDMIAQAYSDFGFKDFWVRISTHDPANKEKYIGDPAIWEESEAALARLIEKRGWTHEVGVGEAAFYGPKLDFIFKDVIGRSWQLSTIQLDMNLPARFELEYTDAESVKQRPVVIHRAILGSTERFLGILIEHYGGAFPLWLAPVQVVFAPVGEAHKEAAAVLTAEFRQLDIRAEVDTSDETVGKKIRSAEKMKVPYMVVVGDKEVAGGDWQVRVRGEQEQLVMSKAAFLERLRQEIQDRV